MRATVNRTPPASRPVSMQVVVVLLARAVRAEEAEDLAGVDGEGQVLGGGRVAVVLAQPVEIDHRATPIARRSSKESGQPVSLSAGQPVRPAAPIDCVWLGQQWLRSGGVRGRAG